MLSAIVLLHSTAAGVQEATTGPFTFSPFLTTLDYLSLYMFILGTVQGLVRPSFHQIRQRTVSGVMPIIHPRSCAQRAKPLLPPTLRLFCWWATSFCASIVCHSCACIISTTPPAVPSSFFFFSSTLKPHSHFAISGGCFKPALLQYINDKKITKNYLYLYIHVSELLWVIQ